jgi:serine/threonine-protein kinase
VQNLTAIGESVGSPHYMSPEQMSSPQLVDERSDVWSLGVVLFELLTGTTPFQSETLPIVFARVIGGEPTPLRKLRGDLPKQVQTLLDRCLSKEPNRRFASAAELSSALSGLARSGHRDARPARDERERAPRRRSGRVAKFAGTIAACAAVAAAVVLYSPGRAQSAGASAVAVAQTMRALVNDAVLSYAPR